MKKIIVLLIAIIINASSVLSQWTECNNGLYGGLTSAFIYKDGYLFAGSTGGLYRSTDNGSTWEHIYNGLPQNGIRALLVVGTNIFAGTASSGVYISTDNGANWTASNSGLTNHSMLSFLQKGLFIFAGTNNGGLFVSINNGTTWTASNSGIPNTDVKNFSTIGDSIYVATGAGVYLSSNNGTSWVARNNGLSSTNINSITYDGTNLYAASHTNGVYKSTNKGDNWTNSSVGLTNFSVLDIKNNVTKVFAATNGDGVFYSNDGGSSWIPASFGLYNTYILRLFFNGFNIYAGSDGGVFYTTNEGGSWNDITPGLTNTVIINLANDGFGNLYAGTYGRGVFKSTNNGSSWYQINTGLEELYCYSLIAKNNYLLGGLWNGQVCRSTDLGGSWSTVVPRTTPRTMVWSFTVIGSNLFYGNSANGVYLSNDNGANWNPVINGLTNTNVMCLAASGSNLFAGTSGGGVFFTTNNGTSWTAVNAGLTNLNINSISANGPNVYAGTSGSGVFISTNNGTSWQSMSSGMGNQQVRSISVSGINLIAATMNGVYYSTNNGSFWQAANGGSLNTNDWALLINGTDVYLGTFGNGVFKAPLSSFTGGSLSTITTGSVQTLICAGSVVNVPYTVTGIFNPGNIFTAQLSDASGNFAIPTVIGTLTSITSGTIPSVIPSGITPGIGYRIRVISSNPAVIGTNNGSNITINPLPVPQINGSSTACENTSQTFTTVNTFGHSYLWEVNGGSIIGNNYLTSVVIGWTTGSSGTVTLVETIDASGCKDSVSKEITINPSPNPIVSGADIVCNRTTHSYSCTMVPGHTYQWSATGGNVVNSNLNTANINWSTTFTTGTVSVTEIINATGCTSTSSKIVSILKMPEPTIAGMKDVCNKSYQIYSTTFTTGDIYLWKASGGSIIGNNNNNNVNIYWNTSQNSGTVTLIETNGTTMCSDSALQVINIHPLPVPKITGPDISFVDSVEKYTAIPINGNSYKWVVNGGNFVGESNNFETRIRWLSPPSGTITLVQTIDATGCLDTTTKVVTIKPFSPYFSGNFNTCENRTETYTAAAITGCTYQWTVTGGTVIGPVNQPVITVNWNVIGSGSVSLLVTQLSSGYQDSSYRAITIFPVPTAPIITGTNTSCVNKIESYSTQSLQGFSYKWKAEGGFIVSDENLPDVQVRWLTEPSGTITLIKSITGSGCSAESNMVVNIYQSPTPKIQGATSTLNNAFEHYSVKNNPSSVYKWEVIGGTLITADNLPEVDVHWGAGTTGRLKAKEINSYNCADSNEILVTLFVSAVEDLSNTSNIRLKIIPNPVNGNAKIEISSSESVNADIKIVNSLGKIVKDFGIIQLNEGTQNIEWNGQEINGELIPSGIYFIRLNSKNGNVFEKILVIR